MIAQATAVTIAENMDDIQAVADTDPTLTLTVDYLIAMIVDEVVEALSTMTATVDAAITVGDDSSSFDETTATVTTAITDTTILEAEIAEEELKQSTTTVASIETLFEAGIHYIEAEFSQYDAWIDYGVWKAISGNMNDTYYNYDFTINDWVLNTSNDIESFILQTDGTWLATLESVWNSPSVTFD